jgi:transposase-like protein
MSPQTTKRTRWTANHAQEILGLWKTSGLSLQRFAKQQGVQVQRLYRWKHLLEKPVAEAFVEVPLKSHSKQAVDVVLPDGVVVRVCESADVPLAVELVCALARHR